MGGLSPSVSDKVFEFLSEGLRRHFVEVSMEAPWKAQVRDFAIR